MKGEFYKMEYEAWDEGTEALKLDEEAAFLRLCHHMYRRRGDVREDLQTLSHLWRCHINKARRILTSLVDAGVIQRTPSGHLTQTRVRRELDARETLSTYRADAGRIGGRRSADTRRANDKKPNEINETETASAETVSKPNQAEKRREEERRGEVEENNVGVSGDDDPNAIFREAASTLKPAGRPAVAYAFEAGIVRLTERDFQAWKQAYPNINLAGELTSMADWAERLKAEGKQWFRVFPSQLVKKDREAKSARERALMEAESRARHLTEQAARSSRPAI